MSAWLRSRLSKNPPINLAELLDPGVLLKVLDEHVHVLKDPLMDLAELLDLLVDNGLVLSTAEVRG